MASAHEAGSDTLGGGIYVKGALVGIFIPLKTRILTPRHADGSRKGIKIVRIRL